MGPPGFEPGTFSTSRKRYTGLNHGPINYEILTSFKNIVVLIIIFYAENNNNNGSLRTKYWLYNSILSYSPLRRSQPSARRRDVVIFSFLSQNANLFIPSFFIVS